MRNKIRLDTLSDVQNFLDKIKDVDKEVYLTDPVHRFKVNAKSILSIILAQTEWNSIWVECEKDIYQLVERWVINE